MANVDNRVVEMKFDNGAFERGVATTLSTLDKLKSKLNFSGATKGLDGLSVAAKNVDLSHMGQGIEALSTKFSALQIAGVTALATIANKAVNVGLNIVKSLTISPISGGLGEYEKKIGSIQTILANTQAAGTTLPQVSAALQELNLYSDKTIYNFGEMARNIGTFTAAGVDLKTATGSIKGIANLAALSGSTSVQASTAMYQLSQAISAGKVAMIDWISVRNAGMGGAVFQRALAQTAVAMGKLPKEAVKLVGPMKNVKINGEAFTKTLSDGPNAGWLTSDVLTTALKNFTGDMKEADLVAQGFSKAQAKAIIAQATLASEAATKVKTASQLMSTLRESAESGWSETWELIIGDFKEAPKLWSSINDAIGGIIQSSADARNNMLKQWKRDGGRDAIIQAVTNTWKALGAVLKPIGDAFRQIFPSGGAANALVAFSKKLREITSHLIVGKETADNLKRTFAGLFAILKIALSIIGGLAKGFFSLFGIIGTGSGGGADALLEITAKVGDFAVAIEKWLTKTKAIQKFFAVLTSPLKLLKPTVDILVALADALASLIVGDFSGFQDKLEGVGNAFKNLFGGIISRYQDFTSVLSDGFAKIEAFFSGVANRAKKSGGAFAEIATVISNVAGAISKFTGEISVFLSRLIDYLKATEVFKDLANRMNLDGVITKIKTEGAKLGKALSEGLADGLEANDIVEAIKKLAQHLIDTFKEFFGIHSPSTVFADLGRNLIEGLALGITAALSFIKGALLAVGGALKDLFGAIFKGIGEAIKGADANTLVAVFDAVLVGGIFLIIRRFLNNFGGIFKGLQKTFNNVAGVFSQLESNLKSMQNNVRADTLMKIAIAIGILTASLFVLTKLDPERLTSALIAMGAMFAGLAASMVIITKFSGKAGAVKTAAIGAAMVALASAVLILAGAAKIFSTMSGEELAKGLGAVAALLAGLVIAANGMEGALPGAAAMFVMASALAVLLPVIALLGLIPYENLAKGLGTIAIALSLLAGAAYLMQGAAPGAVAMIAVATAILILAPALALMGAMSWESIAKGLITLGVALALLVGAVILVAGALPGAIALVAVAGAIAVLAPALALLGQLSWSAIRKGLVALAGALAILVIGMYALTPVIVVMAIFAKSIVLLGAGLLLAGLGMAAFAGALAVLAVSGTAGFAVITAGIVTFLAILPLIARQAGYAFAVFIQVIGENSVKIIQALLRIAMEGIKALQTLIPEGVRTIGIFLSAIVQEVSRRAPEFHRAAIKMIIGFLKNIRDHIGEIVEIAADIIINFTTALGDKADDLADAAFKLIIDLMNGLAEAIRENHDELGEAGLNIASAIGEGLVDGIKGLGGLVKRAAIDLASQLPGWMKKVLGIESPSKVMAEIGRYSALGLVQGLDKGQGGVKRSATDIGDVAINSLRSSMDALSSLTAENMDLVPTITPVFDLSGVKKDSGFIKDLLSTSPMAINATVTKAQEVSSGYNTNQYAASSNTLQMQRDMQTLMAKVAAKTAKETDVTPRPVEFHIGTVQDGDSLLRRARATNKMLSLAEGGDSTQMERIL